jgi:hypothetical protein
MNTASEGSVYRRLFTVSATLDRVMIFCILHFVQSSMHGPLSQIHSALWLAT